MHVYVITRRLYEILFYINITECEKLDETCRRSMCQQTVVIYGFFSYSDLHIGGVYHVLLVSLFSFPVKCRLSLANFRRAMMTMETSSCMALLLSLLLCDTSLSGVPIYSVHLGNVFFSKYTGNSL